MSHASTDPLRCLVVKGRLYDLEITANPTDDENNTRTPSVVRFVPVLNVSEDADGNWKIESDVRREFMTDSTTFDEACNMMRTRECDFVLPDQVYDQRKSTEEALQVVDNHCKTQLETFATSARSLGFACILHDSADPSNRSRFSTDVYHLAVRDFASGQTADYALLNADTIEFHDDSLSPSQMTESEPALRVDTVLRLRSNGSCEGSAICGEADGLSGPIRALFAAHMPHWKDCEVSWSLGGSLGDLHKLAGVLADWTRLHRASEFAEQHGLEVIHS
ncbi:hypothetical protein EHS25_001641 [Saitozyma podzolica]|uniref:Uncharacterized protein n=1 Tax=Saitozyma podzolica TaxID=1890683 RepID=A0A427YH06_9TREE|nr:hypothetical protein EHS25_001641 [Saitozyma podzolica]